MPLDIFSIEHSYELIQAIQQVKQPASFLADTFFPNVRMSTADYVAVETQKLGRRLAPFITKNTRGVNISREKSEIKYYSPLTFAPRRVIGAGDLELRQFGEVPNLFSKPTPEERAARLQAQDLVDLMRLHANRKNQMASEILQSGKVKIKAYADDGKIAEEEEIDFGFSNVITPAVTWDNAAATIYRDLKTISEQIQEDLGEIPTVAILGKNVEQYLINNTEIKNWLMVPSRENLLMANFAPTWTNPQVRHIGRISALNLDLVSYSQTYVAEDGTTKYFVAPDNVILGLAGGGMEIHAPVSIFQSGAWHTISAPFVPSYSSNDDAQTTSLTVYSKYMMVPGDLNSWYTIKTKG